MCYIEQVIGWLWRSFCCWWPYGSFGGANAIRRIPDKGPRIALAAIALVIVSISGCQKPETVHLQGSPALLKQVAGLFYPAKIAIVPAGAGPKVRGDVGAVFAADGARIATIRVAKPGAQLTSVLATFLKAAGLKPVILSGYPGANPPFGTDFMITSQLEHVDFVKRIIHTRAGDRFTMMATVQIAVRLVSVAGVLFKGSTVGVVEEPPAGVSLATYRPELIEPADAISMALSKAIAELLKNSAFVDALPHQHAAP